MSLYVRIGRRLWRSAFAAPACRAYHHRLGVHPQHRILLSYKNRISMIRHHHTSAVDYVEYRSRSIVVRGEADGSLWKRASIHPRRPQVASHPRDASEIVHTILMSSTGWSQTLRLAVLRDRREHGAHLAPEFRIAFHLLLDLVARVHDRRVILLAEFASDLGQGCVREVAR